jgi:hypothetical protein
MAQPRHLDRVCPDCGTRYVTGIDTTFHRNEHAKWARIAQPKPSPKFAALAGENGIVEIDWMSPSWLHTAVTNRARLFRSELEFGHVGWDEKEYTPPEKGRAYLFAGDNLGTIAGACCFRWRDFTNAMPTWAMQWAWIAPPFRRQGIMSRHWPDLLARFGDFVLEPPLSNAMDAFANKANHHFSFTPR